MREALFVYKKRKYARSALCPGRRIVLFLVFTRGQSVLIQPVDKAAAGFL